MRQENKSFSAILTDVLRESRFPATAICNDKREGVSVVERDEREFYFRR